MLALFLRLGVSNLFMYQWRHSLWAAKQICIDVMFFSTLESQPVELNATLIIPSGEA